MAGILQIKRGTVNPSLVAGEFYVYTDSCQVRIGNPNDPTGNGYTTFVTVGCSIDGDILLNGGITANTLQINNNANIDGNLTVTGTTTSTAGFIGNLTGTATNATNATTATNADLVNLQNSSNNTNYYVTFGTNTGYQQIYIDGGITYNPSTDTLNVTNLNATNLTGTSTNATNATNVGITDTNTAGTYYIAFVSTTSGNTNVLVDSSTLTYNPGLDTLTVANVVGNASSATQVKVTDNQNTAGTYYLTFVDGTSGNQDLEVDSTGLTYNPSTNTINATASYATNATNADSAKNADSASYIGVALYTASANLNVITFTKGNGSQFNVTIDTGSIIQTDLLSGITAGQILYNSGGKVGGLSVLTYDGSLLRATGSFSGSFYGTLSGSLYGTASWAYSASQALTASYVLTSKTASYVSSSNVWGPYGWDSIQTASLAYTASFITASNVWGPYGSSSVISASYASESYHAETASYTWFCETISSSYPFDVESLATDNTIFSFNSNKDILTNITYVVDPRNNLFIGKYAGVNTTTSASFEETIALGSFSGQNSTKSQRNIYIGFQSGKDSYNSENSNFIGVNAGQYTSASFVNYIGTNAGQYTQTASYSNFIGYGAGENLKIAEYANIIGWEAGKYTIIANSRNLSYSNIIGYSAAGNIITSKYSNIIGYKAGYRPSGTGFGDNNIIIGTNITLGPNRKDSINIGGIIFGTGSYATTTGNPSTGSSNGRIGINVIDPQFTLDISGSEQLYNYLKFLESGSDPGNQSGANLKSTYLFNSASNNQNGSDLYIRHADNLTKWKWVEGKLSTGLLYGGVLSFSPGQNGFTMSAGAGIIVDYNATTSSEHTPVITYVTWPQREEIIPLIATIANTYVYVGSDGGVNQQSQFFEPDQYRNYIPIGRVSHYNRQSVNNVANHINTAYDIDRQQNIAIRALGPLKINGFDTTASGSSLKINVSPGEAFVLGDYYKQDPNDISHYTNNTTYNTAQIIRVWKSGSAFHFDNNNGTYYTEIDPGLWNDTTTGVTASVQSNKWTTQRVTINPITGRAHIYYGQAEYNTDIEALSAITTEQFEEDVSTANSYVLSAYIVVRGSAADLSDTGDAKFVKAGLFRSTTGGGGVGGATALAQLSDVQLSTLTNGEALIYDSVNGKWINSSAISSSYPISVTGSTQGNSSLYSVNPSAGIPNNTSYDSIFFGYQAGLSSSGVNHSNFFGSGSGYKANDSDHSTFIGENTGNSTDKSPHSIVIGKDAGRELENASYSTLIGYKTGYISGSSIGVNNIIIGRNITLPANTSNAINIGGVLFGTGTYSTLNNYPLSSFSGSAAGKIGVNVVSPSYNFEVSGTVAFPSLTTTSSVSNVVLWGADGQLFYTASSALTTAPQPTHLIYTGSVTASVNIGTGNVFTLVSASNELITVSPTYTEIKTLSGQLNGTWTITSSGKLIIGTGATGLQPLIQLKNVGSPGGDWSLRVNESDDFAIYSENSAASRLYIKSGSGNVGIGFTNPSYNLHASGTIAFPSLTTTSSVSNVVMWGPEGQLFYTASSALTTTNQTKASASFSSSFGGTPRTASVVFGTPFPNNNYSVTVSGQDARIWTIENKVSGSFVINSNSNMPLTNDVYWIATPFNNS